MNISSVDNDFIQYVVEKYSNMLLRIAYQNLKNQSDSEDVVQDVFIRLMRQPVFEDEGHMKAWLIRVTINRCKDLKKTSWFRKVEPLTEAWTPFTDEEQGILEELFKLSKDYRNVIYLHYFEGYTIREIAGILNKKENTISSQLTRARKSLKNILLEGGYSDEKEQLSRNY
ncbi:MAG: sigma-70 family RNA polymerase sigma factor [Clostridiaceae bacterium]